MAAIKKWFITKSEYILAVTVWNALATFIPLHYHLAPETIVLLITVGNAVIAWLSTETETPKVTS